MRWFDRRCQKECNIENKNRKKATVWFKPELLQRIDALLTMDNCKSRSEFVEKAVRFYAGYVTSEDTTEYLSRALVTVQRGILEDNANRLRCLLFKWAVELNMMMHVVARHFGADNIALRELRGYAAEEVKRTNGQFSFNSALEIQRDVDQDGEW